MNTEVTEIRELTGEEIEQVYAGATKCGFKLTCDLDGRNCKAEFSCERTF